MREKTLSQGRYRLYHFGFWILDYKRLTGRTFSAAQSCACCRFPPPTGNARITVWLSKNMRPLLQENQIQGFALPLRVRQSPAERDPPAALDSPPVKLCKKFICVATIKQNGITSDRWGINGVMVECVWFGRH